MAEDMIFTAQDSLRIVLKAGIDLSSATTVYVGMKSPTGTISLLTATKDVTNYATASGAVYKDLIDPLTRKGYWKFWIEAVFPDSRRGVGEAHTVYVYARGTP
jgi:hypothetical protein